MNVTYGIDVSAATLGSAGAAFRVVGKSGVIAKNTGELVDTAFGSNAAGLGFVGSVRAIAEGFNHTGKPSLSPEPGSNASGTTPASAIYSPSGPCLG